MSDREDETLSSETRDARLAELLETLASRPPEDRGRATEGMAQAHPDLAEELRQLSVAMSATDTFVGAVEGMQARSVVLQGERPRASSPVSERSRPSCPPDYEIMEELGRGGMGVVYRARQKSLGRVVALKLMRSPSDDSEVVRFQREAEAAARLEHAQIVPVYEVGTWEGAPYFTMRLIEGRTLEEALRAGPLEPRQAARILLLVSRAVEFAHAHGVIHRDLKPSNILLDSSDTPYVVDFGLAKRAEVDGTLTRTGAALGTPSYMPPEQATGRRGDLGPTCDVYGLGAVLYHMLTGRAPFVAANPLDTLLSVLEEDPVPPRLIHRHVDRDLELVALKCLQKPPELRYSSAQGLVDDLECYLAGETLSVRASGLRLLVTRALRETHHATILENWGLLWIAHSVVLLILCSVTAFLHAQRVSTALPYISVWGVGLGIWAAVFWRLRLRAGPVTFVERQVAHVWGASIIASAMLFLVELLLGFEALTLSPILGVISGMVFFVKAGMLTGQFYIQSFACFATAAAMPFLPQAGVLLFGVVSAACFFVPGVKYHRLRRRA